MNKKFLVAVDGSDPGWKALDLATELAAACGADVIVLHVVPYEPLPKGLQQYAKVEGIPIEDLEAQYHHSTEIGDQITGEAESRARKKGLAKVTTRVVEGNAAGRIVAQAESEDADMVFLGSRGLGDVGGLLMGSVSHKVMHLAPCTCVAVR